MMKQQLKTMLPDKLYSTSGLKTKRNVCAFVVELHKFESNFISKISFFLDVSSSFSSIDSQKIQKDSHCTCNSRQFSHMLNMFTI